MRLLERPERLKDKNKRMTMTNIFQILLPEGEIKHDVMFFCLFSGKQEAKRKQP